MQGHIGRFLALTSSHINAADALFCGLGSHFLSNEQKPALLSRLTEQNWGASAEDNQDLVAALLNDMTPSGALPEAQIEPHLETINAWMSGSDLVEIHERVAAWKGDDTWLSKAQNGLLHGSPLAASWIFKQLNQTQHADLREVFESELILGCNIMRHPEFAEGVRALLVDKDRNPAWTYPDLRSVPDDVVEPFFVAPADMPALGLPE
jgi:enoyl-CoA hydratase/carnithine racemase